MPQAGIPQDFVEALFIVAIIGGIFGVIGGFFGSKRRLVGSVLLGMIGGIALSSIVRIAGYDPVIAVQEDFSALYAAIGGLVLGYVVSRSTA